MSNGICSVEGCDRPTRRKSAAWCNTHYFRWYRTGATGEAAIWGRERKRCTVEGCGTPAVWKSLCLNHSRHMRKHGDVHAIGVATQLRGSDNPGWIGDQATYNTMHSRIRKTRGRAPEHTCSCGAQADHWAYDHLDPNEKISDTGLPYSTDLAHYEPMCVTCHNRFDLPRRARNHHTTQP